MILKIVKWGLAFIPSDIRLKCQTKSSLGDVDMVIARGVYFANQLLNLGYPLYTIFKIKEFLVLVTGVY